VGNFAKWQLASLIAGTQNLENSIDYMLEYLRKDGLDNVHGEDVNVTRWLRNQESARLVEPRDYVIAISSLGSSVGTPEEGILAYAMVVRSFDELVARSEEVSGKIVVFNQDYEGYPKSAIYRVASASRAAEYGAVATLIRSVAPFSIHSVHTGIQYYNESLPKIPTACITIEDAEMLYRMEQRGTRLRIQLIMGAENLNMTRSRNTVAEITGSVYPEQVVVVSGHIDSWDVGQGAMDDGGGAFISWQALTTVRALGLKPKRTLRLVLWTDEEAGGVGSQQYYNAHKTEADNYSVLLESDEGVFTPYGMMFTGSDSAMKVMEGIGKLLPEFLNSSVIYPGGGGTDVGWWRASGVPTGSLANHNEHYFYFHHSDGDTMTVLDPHQMDLCSAVWTAFAYVLADMDDLLPRD
jgi:carboxypeptidase Q